MNVNDILNLPKQQSYEDYRAMVAAEQAGMSREQIVQKLAVESEAITDLDNLPSQNHRWVDRGAVMSCEGAGHANHRSFKLRR